MGYYIGAPMAWSTRSCALWVAAMCLFHVTNLGTAEESVQTLVDDEPLALPGLPRLKGMATAIPVPNAKVGSAVSLGDAHRSGKNYDTPEEEMKALATEDHDANIKSMEMAEHLKATERAKEAEVPEDVTCYHDLVTKAKNQKAMAERLEEEAKDAEERLKSATHLKEETAAAAEKLKRRMERDQKSKTDAEEQYRKEHSTALNAFEAARGNLDNYNKARKKVVLDSTRSKQVLTKYLEYKKKFIEASANADDPTQSKEVAQYRKLSEQYLTSYHALQAKIQESYTSAQRESDLYQQLSQRYQKIAGDANDIAAEVSKTSADLLNLARHTKKSRKNTRSMLQRLKSGNRPMLRRKKLQRLQMQGMPKLTSRPKGPKSTTSNCMHWQESTRRWVRSLSVRWNSTRYVFSISNKISRRQLRKSRHVSNLCHC